MFLSVAPIGTCHQTFPVTVLLPTIDLGMVICIEPSASTTPCAVPSIRLVVVTPPSK